MKKNRKRRAKAGKDMEDMKNNGLAKSFFDKEKYVSCLIFSKNSMNGKW